VSVPQALQIPSTRTITYVYGNERLYGVASSARTWYLGDALGSVRQTLDDAGFVQQTQRYDAWGVPQGPAIAPFGYTGELQQGNQVYLRARWYNAGNGAFGSRDSFAGRIEQPYSLMPYQYGYSAPTIWTDPSGRDPGDPPQPIELPCKPFNFDDPNNPATCRYNVPPITPPTPTLFPPTMALGRPCPLAAPIVTMSSRKPEDIGYIEGSSASASAFGSIVAGIETVFDLYDFEIGSFAYKSDIAFASDVSSGIGPYVGTVTGWSTYKGRDRGVKNYAGPSTWVGGNVTLPFIKSGLFLSGQTFFSEDRNLRGTTVGIGVGVGLPGNPLPGAATWGVSTYTILGTSRIFRSGSQPRYSDALKFAGAIAGLSGGYQVGRAWAIQKILANGYAWEKYYGPK
jgi:RHS repeat-associated protein